MNHPPFDGDFVSLWQSQDDDLTITNHQELMMSLHTQYRVEKRNLFWLNFREGIAAFGLAIILTWTASQDPVGRWAIMAAAVVSLGVGLFLIGSSLRQRRVEAGFGLDLRGELERSRSQMSHRARMYRNVAWWYLTPSAVATGLLVVAFRDAWTPVPLTVFSLLLIGGWTYLYRLNRRIGRTEYEPRVLELTELIGELDPA